MRTGPRPISRVLAFLLRERWHGYAVLDLVTLLVAIAALINWRRC